MTFNWLAVAGAAFFPMIFGFIWYNPKVFGTAWMRASGLTEESMKDANMVLIFGVSLILSFLLSLEMNFIAIHQNHVFSMVANQPNYTDPTSPTGQWLTQVMAAYGNNFRTYKHGALHGAIAGLFFVLPVLGINALFERKSFKYIAINTGFWVICLAFMGAVISHFK